MALTESKMIEALNKDPEKIEKRYFCESLTFYPQTSKEAILCDMRKQFDLDEIAIYPYLGPPNNDFIMVELAGKRKNIDSAIMWAMSMGVRI